MTTNDLANESWKQLRFMLAKGILDTSQGRPLQLPAHLSESAREDDAETLCEISRRICDDIRKPSAEVPGHVRVRVQVAVSSDGSWHAMGDGNSEVARKLLDEDFAEEMNGEAFVMHTVVASVPVPKPAEIVGVVE